MTNVYEQGKRLISLLAALVLALALVVPTAAFAADEKSSEEANVVNERQYPDSSFLYETTILELSTADAYYDGMTVVITGEVVGDCIIAGLDRDSCWLTLYEVNNTSNTLYNPSSIQVFSSMLNAKAIDTYGQYAKRGSVIQVRGTFSLVCAEHDGVTDVHAEQISLKQPGYEQKKDLDLGMFLPGLVLLLVAGLLTLVYMRVKEGQR